VWLTRMRVEADISVVRGAAESDRSRLTVEPPLRVLQLPNAGQMALSGTSGCSRTPNGLFSMCLLQAHNILTLATVREDGYPQATKVGYVHEGLTLYVGTFAQAQKVANIRRCPKV
jgi:Pyridoxamine 5'-phosphate oxidase